MKNELNAKNRGFTLVELAIVVLIIAVLMAIAIPAYTRYITKTRRAAAAGCLSETAQALERHRTINMSYANPPAVSCDASVTAHYTVSVASASTTAFIVEADPQGIQRDKDDATCGILRLDQTGQKTVRLSRAATGIAAPGACF